MDMKDKYNIYIYNKYKDLLNAKKSTELDNNLLTELPMEIGRIDLTVLSVASIPISILPPSYDISDEVNRIQRTFSPHSTFFRNLDFLNFSFTLLSENEIDRLRNIIGSVSPRGISPFFLI